MARRKRIPQYRLHKASGQAVVVIDGQSFYLGKFDTPESRQKYEQILAEWLSRRTVAAREVGQPDTGADLTINELLLAFLKHAQEYYRHPDGTSTGEFDNFRHAAVPLRKLYGRTPVRQFDSVALEAVQGHLERCGRLARTTINARVNRIRRMFRWGVRKKLVPTEVLAELETVEGLKSGRTTAHETEPVRAVSIDVVTKTLPELPEPVRAMVMVQLLSSCRANEVTAMRLCEIDRSGEIWVFRPARHKNSWRGQERAIYLGPQAQAILLPFLERTQPEDYLFRPGDALEAHHARRAAARKTRRTPSESRRVRKRNPKWKPRPCYVTNTYQQAVRRACRRAGVEPWSVLQLRHARATEVRDLFGVEGAQAALGNRSLKAVEVYAEKSDRLAREVARRTG